MLEKFFPKNKKRGYQGEISFQNIVNSMQSYAKILLPQSIEVNGLSTRGGHELNHKEFCRVH